MKIAILTQELHNNYGGLLQAFALQHYLKKQDHDVVTVDFRWDRKPQLFGIKTILGNAIRKYLFRIPLKSIFPLTDEQKRCIGQHTNRFTSENIRTSQTINSLSEFDYIKKYNFDAYIVGSDQVWRPSYSPGISAFFLSFLNDNDKIKRIAYAASFGVDHCNEYSIEDLDYYASLLQKFDAIGVREDSGVKLCKENFRVNAEHVIDPTLLIDKSEYSSLVEKDNILPLDGNMMVYVLDNSSEKENIVDRIAKERNLIPYQIMKDEITGIYPPVTQWLRGFMDAEYVVTDSFHGVVFAIIFNKQFIAIGNKDRGLARFTSILEKFDLLDRLVLSMDEVDVNKINKSIDFDAINRLKKIEQKKSLCFFEKVFNGKL